ncbi:MAG: nucleoside phosphorylase [Deltaproteobacteria bacterium]|nr:nucleoside phosphorylase [Deltaproteobacteria bacterium]
MTGSPHPPNSGAPPTEGDRQYHIGVAPGEVAEAILLVGDPARAERVAGLFGTVEFERRSREYVTYTGAHEGQRVSVVATGMGPDNTEIAVVELCQVVKSPTLIRCGSCGGLQPGVALGDLVISSAAYRLENTSLQFAGEGYPAAAHPEVLLALVQAADEAGARYHVGLTATAPGFYGAQGRNVAGFPTRNPAVVEDLARQGVLNLEMETSCLFTLASLRGIRAGAVCAVFAARHHGSFVGPEEKHDAEGRCIAVALRALHLAAALEAARGARPLWHPGLGPK